MNKPLKPLTEKQQTLIVNNILKACKDINALNKTGYNFIYLASGFIAHYDLYGFKDYYSRHSLRDDILEFAEENQRGHFLKGEYAHEYYMSKKNTYNRIVHALAAQL